MSVAVCSSPVFSPSSSLFCNNKALNISPAHQNLTLSHSHLTPLASSPSAASPTSPFCLRLLKPPVNSVFGSDSGPFDRQLGGVLKRKRPTRLDIPVAPVGVAAPISVNAETTREESGEVEREGDEFSVYCKRGKREAMEDRFSAITNLERDPKQAIFGVYDGHGGSRAAEFAAKNLCNNILGERGSERNESDIEEAVKRGYLTTDSEFLKEKDVKGGSCCVTALIKDGNLVVSNAGDCRAVLSVGGFAEALTSDHRPSRDDERNRIESSGGYVDTFNSVWRIQGSLAVSRGIGDAHLKRWVISEPETKTLRINPQHEFLILASDGLWEKVGNQETVDIARPFCMGTDQNQKPLLACKKLVDLSVSRGSLDDISVMLIPLRRFI
ncbi:probable protein phosphatase 2C 2 [Brassica rapa]|uniref:probable protein phosphatase 2C 2 n=1 Tax=Brassica campestris TaxID=3711 RepID=UPI00142DEDD2|nr:probable protein phosphatase 2C 2 [Brassica rapa]XP_033138126.1 probable protein phosphatase 2C 2 [Brassica rapa]